MNFNVPKNKVLLILFLTIVGGISCWYILTCLVFNVGFKLQYYQPTKLPLGIKITDKRVVINYFDGKFYGTSVDLNFRTEDWVYSIQETKTNSNNAKYISTDLENYDPNSIGVTCKQEISDLGQQYRLCHWIDYGKISVYEIKFIKNETFIETEFPSTLEQTISVAAISNYVDSFVKANVVGFKILIGGP